MPTVSLLAVTLLCASVVPGITAQIASPGNIQNANAGNGGNGGPEQSASSKKCHVSDFELPQELLDATAGANFPGPPHIFGLVGGITAGWDPILKLHETPIAVRFTWLISALNWNCAAVYSQIWDDALTKTDPIIRTPMTAKEVDASSGLFVQERDVSLHTSDTRFLCLAHGWHAVLEDWIPDASAETLLVVLQSLGLRYPGSLGYDGDVGECFADVAGGGVADAICLERIAKDNCYKPAIMGQIVGRQVAEYARTDGKPYSYMLKCILSRENSITAILQPHVRTQFLVSLGAFETYAFFADYIQDGTKTARSTRMELLVRPTAVVSPIQPVIIPPTILVVL